MSGLVIVKKMVANYNTAISQIQRIRGVEQSDCLAWPGIEWALIMGKKLMLQRSKFACLSACGARLGFDGFCLNIFKMAEDRRK